MHFPQAAPFCHTCTFWSDERRNQILVSMAYKIWAFINCSIYAAVLHVWPTLRAAHGDGLSEGSLLKVAKRTESILDHRATLIATKLSHAGHRLEVAPVWMDAQRGVTREHMSLREDNFWQDNAVFTSPRHGENEDRAVNSWCL